MRAELKRIQHEIGQTMVDVTHDQVEAMGMADKIAVMILGVLQQFGTPDELYNKPENRFVANFIGSVLNNFLPWRTSTARSGRRRQRQRARRLGTHGSDRREGRLGREADGLHPARARSPGRVRLSRCGTAGLKISLVEPLGAKDVVHMTYDGLDVRAVGAPGDRPTVGENVGLAFDPAGMHLFDDETGLVLR